MPHRITAGHRLTSKKKCSFALMKMDGVQAIESLNNAVEKEEDEQVKAVFKVAPTQLARRME